MAAMLISAQAVDYNGAVLSGAKLNVYDAGTTTPRAIYASKELASGASSANPAVATATGGIAVWVDDSAGDIKVTLTNSAGTTTYYSQDNIDPTNGNVVIFPLGGQDQTLATTDSVTFAGLTLTGGLSGTTATFTGDLTMSGANIDLDGNDLIIDADRDTYLHATADDAVALVVGGSIVMSWSTAGPSVSGTFAGNMTFSGNPVYTGSPDFSGVANAATIRSDLGLAIDSNVLAYDANLQAFVNAFTAPTADGTSGQYLKTDGAGVLTFATPAGGGDTLAAADESVTGDWNFPGVFNVKNYGATGDGSTDDAAAIQSAIDAAEAASGGVVYFPKGEYLIASGLTVDADNITLRGEGFGLSIITRVGGSFDSLTIGQTTTSATTREACNIYDLEIAAKTTGPTAGALLRLSELRYCTFKNVYLLNGFVGLRSEGLRASVLDNILIRSGQLYGSIQSGSRFAVFENGPVDPDAGNASETVEVAVSNFNFVTNSASAYIEYGLEIQEADGIWFSNGHLRGASEANVYINGTSSPQLLGMMFSNVWSDGLTKKNLLVDNAPSPGLLGLIQWTGGKMTGATENAVHVAASCGLQSFNMCGVEIAYVDAAIACLFEDGATVNLTGCDFNNLNASNAASASAIKITGGEAFTITGGSLSESVNIDDAILDTRSSGALSVVGFQFFDLDDAANGVTVNNTAIRQHIFCGTDQTQRYVEGVAHIGGITVHQKFRAPRATTQTIATGSITYAGMFQVLDTEGAASTDDLDTISGGGDGDVLILRTASSGRDVTVKNGTGNIVLKSDFTLATASDKIMLIYDPSISGGSWVELARWRSDGAESFGPLTASSLSLTGSAVVGSAFSTTLGSELTISFGTITVTGSYHKVDTESDAASDDLDTISGGISGMRLVLRAASSARSVVLKDGTGNLALAGDYTLTAATDAIELIFDPEISGGRWVELTRSDNDV